MRIVVAYATREGQTRRIAEHVATALGSRGVKVDLHDMRTPALAIEWSQYDWACVAASVHAGHHEPEVIAFVKTHRQELQRLRAAFLSVTLSEAGAEDTSAPRQRREQAAADAQRMIDVFVQETGWHPARSLAVAGALAYSHYNFIVRFVMTRIARKAGAPTDTSRDYEFTDWSRLDRFIRDAAPDALRDLGPAHRP
jgi:menaquinone-dependent protoporphyrinogen oxidase